MTYAGLEDAVLSALEGLRTTLGVRTLESYGGDFNLADLDRQAVVFPALLVHVPEYGPAPPVNGVADSNRSRAASYTLIVYAADRNSRGGSAARRGDATVSSPGVYGLLEAARVLLDGLHLGPASNLRWEREALLAHVKTAPICIGMAKYSLLVNERRNVRA